MGYNTLSFALASMMATTMYLWFRSTAVHDKYKSAVLTSGLVTFIAAYHYIRIFNSWVEAYSYSAGGIRDGALDITAPQLTSSRSAVLACSSTRFPTPSRSRRHERGAGFFRGRGRRSARGRHVGTPLSLLARVRCHGRIFVVK